MNHPSDTPRRGRLENATDLWALAASLLVLGALPFVVYLRLRTPVRGQVYFLQIAAFAGFAVFALLRTIGPVRRPRLDVPLAAIAISALAIVLSALIGPRPEFGMATSLYSLSNAMLWFAGVALFLMLRHAGRRWNLFAIVPWILIAQGAILAAYGIAQFHGWEFLPYSENFQKNRVISTFGHPNFFGSFMGPVMFLCLARAAAPVACKSPELRLWIAAIRLASVLVAVEIAYALKLAESRAIWIGSVLGLGVAGALALLAHRAAIGRVLSHRGPKLALGVGVILLVIASIAAGPGRQARAAASKLNALIARPEFENRLYFWYIASGMRRPTWPLGTGVKGFQREFWDDVDVHQQTPEGRLFARNLYSIMGEEHSLDPGNVHNDYLEIRAESGPGALFGHLLLAAYLFWFFAAAALRRREGAGAPAIGRNALILGGLTCMLFDQTLGFPMSLPCSLAVWWYYAALMNQTIEEPARWA